MAPAGGLAGPPRRYINREAQAATKLGPVAHNTVGTNEQECACPAGGPDRAMADEQKQVVETQEDERPAAETPSDGVVQVQAGEPRENSHEDEVAMHAEALEKELLKQEDEAYWKEEEARTAAALEAHAAAKRRVRDTNERPADRAQALRTIAANNTLLSDGEDSLMRECGKLLSDEHDDVRAAACAALASVNVEAKEYFDTLLCLCETDASNDVKRAAAVAVYRIGGAQAIDTMARAAVAVDREMRVIGATGLGALKAINKVDILGSLLKDSYTPVRIAAVDSLAAFGEGAASQAGLLAKKAKEPLLRAKAIVAVGRCGEAGKKHLQDILCWMTCTDTDVRLAVCEALEHIGDESCLEMLSDVISDSSKQIVRDAAEVALRAIKARSSCEL
eukprot:gnl/TRDRNA2_/TRDRNA2_80431_c0_seq1.p1 gnl/TRDRNA2_/TRDRNA2_80431_c0~~gnl/TRDRNA2_/TRDRNA2_80431_c0_seq1.p1  ORF type:complete len:392 (-),score=88.93 gnl/TRDRNA2_/TRDRNA2_80431_c0_seq1:34-1209(-)